MATLEKPRKEKKTKSKQRSQVESVAAASSPIVEEEAQQRAEVQHALVDFEQFEAKATTSADIVSHECFSANNYSEDLNSAETREVTEESAPCISDVDADVAFHVAEEPTAPPSSALPATIPLHIPELVTVQYPKLDSLQRVEAKTQVVYQIKSPSFCFTRSNLQPFTAEQWKELYHCTELEIVNQFEIEFLMNSLHEIYDSDPLYIALLEYYNVQSKLTMNMHDVKTSRKDVIDAKQQIWHKVPESKTFSGRCGDGVIVKETVTYDVMQMDDKYVQLTTSGLNNVFQLVCYTFTTNLINAEITKAKIDEMINELIAHPAGENIDPQSPTTLNDMLDRNRFECVASLRHAISILFYFIRKPSPNKKFDGDLKYWLRKLISLHLRLATREDHWFLLFNILRCPSGVGSWAASFLQIPGVNTDARTQATSNALPLPITSAEMNHCIAVLQVLLFPIKKRQDYLKALSQSEKEISDPVKEERWIFIDSDGEDAHTTSGDCAGLKESDLIALLNQIPFEMVFCSALGVEKFLNDYIIQENAITSAEMLRVVAFFFKLIEIFGEGMLTYNTERYKQLAKRLGRLIRHTLQYISDHYELFRHNTKRKDVLTCERIAVELNALLMKACSYIYRTRNLATWQYFSSLPYKALDKETIWQIFYYVSTGILLNESNSSENYLEQINSKDFWHKFNLAHADSSAEDMCYLLQSYFEMANERDSSLDDKLIKMICLHIFNIGYINDSTRETCYKASRDMLLNLTLVYEDLISSILMQLKIRFNEIENAVYLFKSLPLENWKPDMESFEILSNWLLHFDFQSKENMMARIIISHLNWGFDTDGRLFLPHNIHVRMACLITEALTKHAPEVIGLTGITESVRQISSLIDFTQATKEQFTTWCWTMVSMLRLHLMDQSIMSVAGTLRNPTEQLMFIPELERIDLIYQGVTENRPLAIYVALLISLHGHSIPLICQKGLELIKLLLNDYRHAAVIRCLELIVPLFIETPETLANCESFQLILNLLLNADRSYLKMAKDIIYPNSVGPVIQMLDNMIHHQITSYANYGLATPLNLINVWLNCLTSLTNWPNTSVPYLLDKILGVAYQFQDARLQSVEYFRIYYRDCDEWKGSNKRNTLKMLFTSNVTRLPSPSPCHIWLALILLEIEFQTQEAHFWSEFLRQLVISDSKANVETALKKTASVVKMPSFPPQMLVIYKYANLLANTNIKHPAYPILNQKFFELYLSRLPQHYDGPSFQSTYGVSDKFYEYNIPLMKKIKSNITAALKYYAYEAKQLADQDDVSYVHRECAKMMKTYILWLEETDINRRDIGTYNFPPQYNNEKLHEILNGNTPHWTEFIHMPTIRKEQIQQAEQWARTCHRHVLCRKPRSAHQTSTQSTPLDRIKTHLRTYDNRSMPPDYHRPPSRRNYKITNSTINDLKQKLKSLNSTANKFHYQTSELSSLTRNYLDILPNLYKMEAYEAIKSKACSSLMYNHRCKSAARITTTLKHIRTSNEVQGKINNYCERHDRIIDEMLKANVVDFVLNVQDTSTIIELLVTAQKRPDGKANCVASTGIEFFYTLITNMTDVSMKFAPTNDLYSQTLNELSIFIQENQEHEGLKILQLALKRPDLLKVLSTAFVPYRTAPEHFLKMYKFLIESYLKQCDTKILFVLLSKFDLIAWLDNFKPKLYDINQLLQLVLNGLESWSQPDSVLLQDQFRRHLVHIFNHDFPQHYGEVMQLVLDRVSDQKLMPVVLFDILNSLLERFHCVNVSTETNMEQMTEIATDFARRQNLFNLKAATDTVMLFARHFQKERLHHGLHGLYPKHKDYCQPLSLWFTCFGHVVVITAIYTYQDLLADQISDVVFGSIVEMYAPWLILYTPQTMLQQSASSWIRQLTENGTKTLNPWSEQHVKTCKIMIQAFVGTLNFVLESLPVSDVVLSHTFSWYIHHFATISVEQYIQAPIQAGISLLPWERFKPGPTYIDMLYDSLQRYIPGAHAMLGHIFIRINWNEWMSEFLPTLPSAVQTSVISKLYTIFIKISFEPNIHIHINTSKILEDAIRYPWHLVATSELENLLKWFVTSVEPTIILKLPTETNYADRAVLDLLRLGCNMMSERVQIQASTQTIEKCILYVRTIVRLLRACAAKNHKLLASKDGLAIFKNAFLDLLHSMDQTLNGLQHNCSLPERQSHASKLMQEIILPMQTQGQETSNLHVETIIEFQECHSNAGNLLLLSILEVIGRMKSFITCTYQLLEASIVYYFRQSEECKDWHTPSWTALIRIIHSSLDRLELMPIISGQHYFNLHIYIMFKTEQISNSGDKIVFLQDICQLTENFKTKQQTEPRLAIIWGLMVAVGCRLLATTEHVKKPLLMLARHLHVISVQADGWGDGLLGAIGFKRDIVSNKRKVLTRCIACVIFSLFPSKTNENYAQPNEEFASSLRELTALLANKKFADVKPLIAQAVNFIGEQKTPEVRDAPHLICRLITIFYADNFLTTIPEIWDFEYRMSYDN